MVSIWWTIVSKITDVTMTIKIMIKKLKGSTNEPT